MNWEIRKGKKQPTTIGTIIMLNNAYIRNALNFASLTGFQSFLIDSVFFHLARDFFHFLLFDKCFLQLEICGLKIFLIVEFGKSEETKTHQSNSFQCVTFLLLSFDRFLEIFVFTNKFFDLMNRIA